MIPHRILSAALFACVCAPVALAQQAATSAVSGVITDPSGASIANANITIADIARDTQTAIKSDAKGSFAFAALTPGRYKLTVDAPGFAAFTSMVELAIGKTTNVPVRMQVATASTNVEVTSTVAQLDPTSSTVDKVIDSAAIENIPLNGRNYLELSLLAPGNAPAPTFDPTKSHTVLISSAGQMGRGGNVTVDGADNNDDVVGGSLVNIPQDAVAEFQMATNRYSAALGRSASSVTNVVTKQGSNAIRGSVAFFERDKALNAHPIQFSATPDPVPAFHRQQYAGSLGGPIKKDRAWWFASVEDRQQLGGGLVGTRNFATQSIDRSLIQQPLHDWLSTVRADVQATAHDRVGVRESLELEDDLSASTLDRAIGSATQQQQSKNHYQGVVADWTHTFSSTLLNQFRFADNNFFNDIEPTTRAPQISFPSFQDGASFRVPQQTRQFRLQWSDTLNWTKGAHNIAVGGELQRVDADFFLGVFQQGMLVAVENFPDFDRNGDGVVNDNDLLFAVALQSGHADLPVLIPDARNYYSATFVQDDWRMRRNLTFNLGLRYEADSDANNRSRVAEINPIVQPFLSGKRRSLNNNWGPRVGFAYSPDEHTVIRGGYGLYYDRITLEIESLERGLDGRTLPINAHLGNVAFLNPDGTFVPIAPTLANPFSGPVIPGAGASGIDIIDNKLRNPMVQQFSLGVERGFGKTMTLRVDGVHNLGTHFIIGRKVGNVFNPDAGGPDTVNNIESTVNTHYDALLVSARKTFSSVGEFNVAYTLSKSLNYANDDQIPFTSGPIDPNDLRREYGPTPNDQRHRLVISGTSRLPYGFRISPLLTVASSVPMDILLPDGSSRIPLLGRNAGGRQFHNAGELNAFLTQVNTAGGIDGTPLPLVDPSAKFASAYSSFDMRLSREFRFGERMRFEAIGEAFNLFNKTNILGTSNLDFSGYQNVLVRDSNDPTSAGFLHSTAFGKPVSAAGGIFGSGGPRAFQVAARFSF